MTTVRLLDCADPQLPFQVHALVEWTDPVTHEPESYLAGFATFEARSIYVALTGLTVARHDRR